jgi:hypothetical protein
VDRDEAVKEISRLTAVEKIAFPLIAAFLALCLGATLFVTFSGQLPILNQSFGLQRAINFGIIGGALGMIAILLLAMVMPRLIWVGRCVALLVLFLASLEVELRIFDHFAISVDHSFVDIASRPVKAGDAEIFLPQSTAISPLGFRWAHREPVRKTGYRVLMLGNSFVHGSGTTFATNYPQVLEGLLKKRFPDRNVTVMPAGVNGYGVVEEHQLYRYLINKGYDFDLVVLNYTTGTDPSQNQPGTKLTVIAGQKQRLHDSAFLRAFYPLNYYTARYLIYLRGMSKTVDAPVKDKAGPKDADGCPPNPAFAASTLERINYYYRPAGLQRVPVDMSIDALMTLGKDVQANGQKFMTILLPDRNAVLEGSRSRFAGSPMDWTWIRDRISHRVGTGWPLLDMSDLFNNRPDLFFCGDGHWNDEGNLHGAKLADEFVGNHIN